MKFSLDREHAPTTVAMILAILMLAASLVLMVIPKPKEGIAEKKIVKDTKNLRTAKTNSDSASQKLQLQIANQVWTVSSSQIQTTVLNLATKNAAKQNVQVVSVRPQRTVVSGDLTQTAYIINLTGTYTDVLQFAKDLDTPDSRLAVENIQVGAADEKSDNVTASITVEACVLTSPATATSATASASKVKKGITPLMPGTPRTAAPRTSSGGSNVKA